MKTYTQPTVRVIRNAALSNQRIIKTVQALYDNATSEADRLFWRQRLAELQGKR